MKKRMESRMISRFLSNLRDKNVIHWDRKGWGKNQFGEGNMLILSSLLDVQEVIPRRQTCETGAQGDFKLKICIWESLAYRWYLEPGHQMRSPGRTGERRNGGKIMHWVSWDLPRIKCQEETELQPAKTIEKIVILFGTTLSVTRLEVEELKEQVGSKEAH